jgi:hypothetical protein
MQAKIDVGELKLRNSAEGDTLIFFLKGKQRQKDFPFLLRVVEEKTKFLLLFYQDKC